MKKLFKNTILLFSILLVLGACDTKPILTLVPSANTTLSISDNTVVLTEADAGNKAFTLTWSDPNFGFDAAASYTILIDLYGGDFSNPQTIAMGADLSKAFTGQELNSKALALGIKPNVPTKIDFKVQTTLSGAQQMMSGAVTVTVTAFSSLLDLSTNWGVVGSATPGGWGNPDIPDLPFYTTSEAGVYIAYVTLRDGEIKFRLDNAWTTNYGDDGADGSLEQNGANIAVTEGTYKIMVNTNDFSWSMEPFSWGLVGSATPNGWGAPDFKLHYNSYADNWKTVITFTTGEFKFRFNEDWGVNLGDNGADGVADAGGDNIAVTEGHYLVTLDLNTNEYTVEKIDVWGLVGSATPNGWDGPDTKFTPDFGSNEGVFYITGITLVDGEIKIRQNDAWGINYGDDGNDGTVELNGANIPVTAGIYNITFDSVSGTIVMHKW